MLLAAATALSQPALTIRANETTESTGVFEIYSFAPLNENQKELSFSGHPSAEQVASAMPKTLTVYLEQGEEEKELPVTWEPREEDYAETSYFYYEFLPVLPEGYVSAVDEDEIPVIGVHLTKEMKGHQLERTGSAVYHQENMDPIFLFARDTMGLNTAASCGVLANIYVESAYDPQAVNDYSGAYGLCQWTGGRLQNLKNYCSNNGLKVKKLQSQLLFMKYEMEVLTADSLDTLAQLRAVPNTKAGAKKAGHIFCDVYERPDDPGTSNTRADLAKGFWDKYAGNIYDGGDRVVVRGATVNMKPSVTEFTPTIWTSSNPEVATVTPDGVVTGVKKGSCTISATPGGAISDVKTFDVTVKKVRFKGETTWRTNETFSLEGYLPDYYELEDMGLEVKKYKSSKKTVFAVDRDGTVTPGKNGAAKLQVIFRYLTEEGSYEPAGTLSMKFKLRKPEIQLDSVDLLVGAKAGLNIANRDDSVYLRFESDDSTVAEAIEDNGQYYIKVNGKKGESTTLYLFLNYETEPTDSLKVTIR